MLNLAIFQKLGIYLKRKIWIGNTQKVTEETIFQQLMIEHEI